MSGTRSRNWLRAEDVISFLFVCVLGLHQRWEPVDLVFGLWIGSLCSGLLLLLLTFGTSILFPAAAKIPVEQRTRQRAVAMVVIGGIFMGVFCVWHGSYIGLFADFVEVPGVPDPEALSGSVRPFLVVVGACLALYWPLVLSAAVPALGAFVRAVTSDDDDDLILGPWVRLIRMHLVAFVLFAAHLLGSRSTMLVLLLAAAWFPMERLVVLHTRHRRAAESPPGA